MADSIPALFSSLLLGGLVSLMAYMAKLLPNASPVAYLIPVLCAGLGWALLDAWRETAGRTHAGPILHYTVIVLAVFVLYGLLFSPAGQPQPLSGLTGIALLAPAVSDFVRGWGHFEKEKEEAEINVEQQPFSL